MFPSEPTGRCQKLTRLFEAGRFEGVDYGDSDTPRGQTQAGVAARDGDGMSAQEAATLFECLRRQSHRVVAAAENNGEVFGASIAHHITELKGWLEMINDKLGMLQGGCAPLESPRSPMH